MSDIDRLTIRLTKRELRYLKELAKTTGSLSSSVRHLISEAIKNKYAKKAISEEHLLMLKNYSLLKEFLKDYHERSSTTILRAEETAMEIAESLE